mmetsp:Transcript_10099/g.29016  ORF Transcript_10099/g.29016 Transcript_10099/m.29016 type:complete len:101 (-) Transcript_10099:970-1272(-)
MARELPAPPPPPQEPTRSNVVTTQTAPLEPNSTTTQTVAPTPNDTSTQTAVSSSVSTATETQTLPPEDLASQPSQTEVACQTSTAPAGVSHFGVQCNSSN